MFNRTVITVIARNGQVNQNAGKIEQLCQTVSCVEAATRKVSETIRATFAIEL